MGHQDVEGWDAHLKRAPHGEVKQRRAADPENEQPSTSSGDLIEISSINERT